MFTLATGPPFFMGIFHGLEKRHEQGYLDPYAHWKVMGVSTFYCSVVSAYEATKHEPWRPKIHIATTSGALAGVIVSGSLYYLGLKMGAAVPKSLL